MDWWNILSAMFWGILSAVGSDMYIFEYSKCESGTLD